MRRGSPDMVISKPQALEVADALLLAAKAGNDALSILPAGRGSEHLPKLQKLILEMRGRIDALKPPEQSA